MRSEGVHAALQDVHRHVLLALELTDGFDQARVVDDILMFYAAVRCLEIISEAPRKLPDELKGRTSDIAWRNIAAADHVYRYEYQEVSPRLVWETVRVALGPLLTAVEAELGPGRPARAAYLRPWA